MTTLVHQRCFHHGDREAVARCPECRQYYCRECVTEHDDRVICAACLKRLARTPLTQRSGFRRTIRSIQILAGLVLTWFFFFLLGEILLSARTSSHRGTLWQASWKDER